MKKLLIATLLIQLAPNAYSASFLFNGSSDMESDHISFYLDIEGGQKLLSRENPFIFLPDFSNRSLDSMPSIDPFTIVSHANLSSESIADTYDKANKVIRGLKAIKSSKSSSFENLYSLAEKQSKLDSKFSYYFTDHGDYDYEEDKFTISTPDGDIETKDLDKLVSLHKKNRPGSNVIFMQDHCFSAGHLSLIYGDKKELSVREGVCGFASSAADETSQSDESMMNYFSNVLGSRPSELKSRDVDGNGKISYREAFDGYKQWFVDNPYIGHSTPMSSTDVYLNDLYNRLESEDENISSVTSAECEEQPLGRSQLRSSFALVYLDSSLKRVKGNLEKSLAGYGILSKNVSVGMIEGLISDNIQEWIDNESAEMELEEKNAMLYQRYYEFIDQYGMLDEEAKDRAAALISELPMDKNKFRDQLYNSLFPTSAEINVPMFNRKVDEFFRAYDSISKESDKVYKNYERLEVKKSTLKSILRDMKSTAALKKLQDKVRSNKHDNLIFAEKVVLSMTRLDRCEGQEFFR